MKTKRTSSTLHGFKALLDQGTGVFEAIVSVFGNVDLHGDRILPGAFANSLTRWAASGDPIPVIWSHQWDNLDAHVGYVLEAKELFPGDPALEGTGLEANGGLWIKARMDTDEQPFAFKLWSHLESRRIREFSFAYDVLDERRASDGANDLVELDVIEVGPTLKGANPATVLLSKGLSGLDDGLLELVQAGAKATAHTFAASDEDSSRCVLCGQTSSTVIHNSQAAPKTGEKALVPVTFDGAVEADLEAMYAAAWSWASGGDMGNGGFYALHGAATFPSENRSIVLVEGWDDPVGEGVLYELSFTTDEAGVRTVAEANEIEVAAEVVRKSLSMKHRGRSAPAEKARGTVGDEPKDGKAKGKPEEPRTGPTETDGGDPALVELELMELGLS